MVTSKRDRDPQVRKQSSMRYFAHICAVCGIVAVAFLQSGGRQDAIPPAAAPSDSDHWERPFDPLVPPIEIAKTATIAPQANVSREQAQTALDILRRSDRRRFTHDAAAHFHPHGDQVCASGCAASRHPTKQLTEDRFRRLLREYADQASNESGPALDELLFYGPQSANFIDRFGVEPLDQERATCLRSQLQFTHAKIAIRVIDSNGRRRTWLDPTSVPLDRRHVFEMETDQLQPLVTSGTIKRVGLDRLWTRL
jgi:hypothetical protein